MLASFASPGHVIARAACTAGWDESPFGFGAEPKYSSSAWPRRRSSALRGKDVLLDVIDVGTETAETPED
jgi:hypothetical protein